MKLHTLNSQAISHPIHRLPLELLDHIFHLLFEIEASWNYEFPLNLTQVCSQWKSAVLSVRNRRLWSKVKINPVDPDWLERLNLYLFLSRDEGIHIDTMGMTQSVVDALTGHHRRIHSLDGILIMTQIWDSTISEPDTIQVVIRDQFKNDPFPIPLSSFVTALPYMQLGEGSLYRLQSFLQLQEIQIETQTTQLFELGSPLQLPALQRLLLNTHENPLDFLRILAPSQLLDLEVMILESLSPEVYYELETFIIGHMPNLRRVTLRAYKYVDSDFVQPAEESAAQSSSALMQSENLQRIDCRIDWWSNDNPSFRRLIESAPHLEECYFPAPIKSLPSFSHQIRKLGLKLYDSPILPVVNGGLLKLAHLEVLKLTFTTAEHLQLLALVQAPSLLSLQVSYVFEDEDDSQSHLIPADAILAFISTSRGIRNMRLDHCFPVGGTSLPLPELRNLMVLNISHIFSLASFDVPKLQQLYLEIDDGRGEGKFIARDEDLAEDPIEIASPPPDIEAVGSSNVLDKVNTKRILEMGNEEQKRKILEEDDDEAKINRLKNMDLREVPSDPSVARDPPFPALTFEHLKVFEFWVLSAYHSRLMRTDPRFPHADTAFPALPYFPDTLTAFPALERVTLPAVSFNDSTYIDQLVNKISENHTLCRNLQEIRTYDYPNDWSNLFKFLRDRKRASMLSNTAPQPIHALHFHTTPHASIVEQLQDAMLGKVSTKSFPAICPWPLIDSTFVGVPPSLGEGTQVESDEETRSPVQDGDERTVATRQEEDITGNREKQNENESGYGANEDEALSCFFCHKAGLGASCQRVRKRGILSRMEVSSGDVRCSRWDGVLASWNKLEVICIP